MEKEKLKGTLKLVNQQITKLKIDIDRALTGNNFTRGLELMGKLLEAGAAKTQLEFFISEE